MKGEAFDAVALPGRAELVQLRLAGGRIDVAPSDALQAKHILLPKLVEAHCHLDKCHTLPRLGEVGGDLMAAILAQRADKVHWNAQDLEARMTRGMSELAASGCAWARSHIDWGEGIEPPLSWHVAQGLATPDGLHIQWAGLIDIAQWADSGGEVARHVAASQNGVLGTFILDHDPTLVETGLRAMFRAADRFGLMLDFHVDEGLGNSNGLERIADIALETGFQAPILCGHAVSLMNKSASDVSRIADKLARAGISVCALPTTNLYLQDRGLGSPDRRGVTRLRELAAAGVNIVVGSDNVSDAFCPVGAHDPMAALHLALLSAHLDPPLDRWLATITDNARRAIGVPDPALEGGKAQDFLIYDTASLSDVIAGRAKPRQLT